MANPEHVALLRKSVDEWNAWRTDSRDEPDLRGADLSGTDLSNANLVAARLLGANLTNANLTDADLTMANLMKSDVAGSTLAAAQLGGATLAGADLSQSILLGANLRGTNLRRASLLDADLRGARLVGANLSGTTLGRANLSNAQCGGTIFAEIDLSGVIGLESVQHEGPSTIGIDTIYLTRGKVPVVFLRGCGVPDALVDLLPSIIEVVTPTRYNSCFISYSTNDEEFAKQLYSRMREERLRVWYAPEELKAGRKIHEEIDQAIRIYDKLLIVVSENSIASEWVKTEIANAREKEAGTGKRVLFPIRLVDYEAIRRWKAFDADAGKDLAREIREYFIPDFSNWKNHDSFEAAFAKLLDALKKDEAGD